MIKKFSALAIYGYLLLMRPKITLQPVFSTGYVRFMNQIMKQINDAIQQQNCEYIEIYEPDIYETAE